MADRDEGLDALAVLTEPARRALYEYVVTVPGEVGRDEAARAVGVSRSLAAFHLDKLVQTGLLEVSYRRLTGRSGPGAGRPAKLYRRADREYVVSVPPREYQWIAHLLAEVVDRAGLEPQAEATARRAGHTAAAVPPGTDGMDGTDGAADTGGHAGDTGGADRGDGTAELVALLAGRGYRPRPGVAEDGQRGSGDPAEDGQADEAPVAEGPAGGAVDPAGPVIRLGNCPFRQLAREFPPLVCGMNLALIEGLLAGLPAGRGWTARMDPRPGECCVALVRNRPDSKNK